MASKPWTVHGLAPDIRFTNGHIVDPAKGRIYSDQDLIVSGGRIAPHADYSADFITIDLQGAYLCPGLVDCHVHMTATPGQPNVRSLYEMHPDTVAWRTAWVAKEMLLRGFTTARDTGGGHGALRDAIAEGLIPGPRLFVAGKALSQTGGHGDLRAPHEGDTIKCCGGDGTYIARICDGVPACLEAARDELRRGADFLKIMVGGGVASPTDPLDMIQFTAEEIRAIVGAADNLHTYVTAHAYTNEAIRHAVTNGVRCIEHANFIDAETARFCRDHGVTVVPTLVTYQAILSPENAKFLPEDGKRKAKTVIDAGITALQILKDNGVLVCFGTDILGNMHEKQHGEWDIRAAALSQEEVLRSATTHAATLLKMQGKIGTLDVGAYADILILDRNPLEDRTAFTKFGESCKAILKDGRVVMSKLETEGLLIDKLYH